MEYGYYWLRHPVKYARAFLTLIMVMYSDVKSSIDSKIFLSYKYMLPSIKFLVLGFESTFF